MCGPSPAEPGFSHLQNGCFKLNRNALNRESKQKLKHRDFRKHVLCLTKSWLMGTDTAEGVC